MKQPEHQLETSDLAPMLGRGATVKLLLLSAAAGDGILCILKLSSESHLSICNETGAKRCVICVQG